MEDPIAVLLKLAFIAVLYLFLLWVSRSALRDLRRGRPQPRSEGDPARQPVLIVEGGGGLDVGLAFTVNGAVTIGRSPRADVQIEDSFASARHARVYERGGCFYLEDMGSTNGTYLNGRKLRGHELLSREDRIRIGDTEFRYEQ